ncbi:MAG: metallophosphoesterase family protein [Clostridia bacterium]|nr:metallophosphoesterase family protein [Clostridia bacterium]
MKKQLRFKKDKPFRIFLMSDLHGGKGVSDQLPEAIEAVMAKYEPDLVLLGGDTAGCGPVHVETEQDLREYLDIITEPMNKRNIPWAHVFGNHDDNYGLSREKQQEIYESYPLCLSEAGPEEISGVGNYCLPVFASDSDKIKFAVWGFDSHDNLRGFRREYGLPEDMKIVLHNHLHDGTDYDGVHFDQAAWYYFESMRLEKENGEKIPGMMYMHIAIPEFYLVSQNYHDCKCYGSKCENVASGEINFGLFAACLQRGDIKAIFAGHDHINDFHGTYCGIKFAYDGGLTYDGYQRDWIRGGRLIEINENDNWNFTSDMVYISDIMGEKGNKRK